MQNYDWNSSSVKENEKYAKDLLEHDSLTAYEIAWILVVFNPKKNLDYYFNAIVKAVIADKLKPCRMAATPPPVFTSLGERRPIVHPDDSFLTKEFTEWAGSHNYNLSDDIKIEECKGKEFKTRNKIVEAAIKALEERLQAFGLVSNHTPDHFEKHEKLLYRLGFVLTSWKSLKQDDGRPEDQNTLILAINRILMKDKEGSLSDSYFDQFFPQANKFYKKCFPQLEKKKAKNHQNYKN